MKYTISNLRLLPGDDIDTLKEAAARKLGIGRNEITALRIVKESIDARRKPRINIVYSVLAETDRRIATVDNDIKEARQEYYRQPAPGNSFLKHRPVIIGSGPAGLFCALLLAESGYRPIIVERGADVETRTELVRKFWNRGILDTDTNVQFGEGGAGTFSDGKLTTRINDRRCEKVLEEFKISGAPDEILFKSKPHIGTDNLKKVVMNIRKRIQQLGGDFFFNYTMTSIVKENDRIKGIVLDENRFLQAEAVVLAIGHSARDTYQALFEAGLTFARKPFSIGVRIEHPQELINIAQYGSSDSLDILGAADYQLFCKLGSRTAYSFCMCPGGIVVAAASEPESIVTNGMSEFSRSRDNANSALVVSVNPDDFEGIGPLAGIEYQRIWERMAFKAGGSCYSAPVQKLGDFIKGIPSAGPGRVIPSYTGQVKFTDLHGCLPAYVSKAITEAIPFFDSKLKGFGMNDAILTGVETRTSSPVRILREDTLEAQNIGGLYPAGEGAGYAGGIVSAAVDGIRIAEQIISTYSKPYEGI